MSFSPVIRKEKVGSRVTCSPAPTNTDDDTLVLVRAYKLDDYIEFLSKNGWVKEGADHGAPSSYDGDGEPSPFTSLRKGNQNYIVTSSGDFFNRFMAATSVATRLNLLKKEDRIALFQAVLYGNPRTISSSDEGAEDADWIEF